MQGRTGPQLGSGLPRIKHDVRQVARASLARCMLKYYGLAPNAGPFPSWPMAMPGEQPAPGGRSQGCHTLSLYLPSVQVYQRLADQDGISLDSSPHSVKEFSMTSLTGDYRHVLHKPRWESPATPTHALPSS